VIDWRKQFLSKKGKTVISAVFTVALVWLFVGLSVTNQLPLGFGSSINSTSTDARTLNFALFSRNFTLALNNQPDSLFSAENLIMFFDFFRTFVVVLLIPLIIGSFFTGSLLNFEGHGWRSASKNALHSLVAFSASLAVTANVHWPLVLGSPPSTIGLLVGEAFMIGSGTIFFYLPAGITGFIAEKTLRLYVKERAASQQQIGPTSSLVPKGYVIIKELGSGGFANVVLAKDKKREVVLKLIRGADKEKEKALQEAQVQYNLGHRNIVEVYEFIPQPLCIVEEYCNGGNLLDQVSNKPLAEVAKLLVKTGICIGGALSVIHQCRYVHLDIKPENILFKKEGKNLVPKLSDFGTAKALGSAGGMTCTPQYLPPAYPLPIDTADHRLDVYQLGLSLYVPLAACTLRKTHLDIERLKQNPIFLSSQCPEIMPELDQVLQKAINVRGKDFSKAYQNAKEFTDDLAKLKLA
jgi:hypothetical protein